MPDLMPDRIRRLAAADGVALAFVDGIWIATDTATGARASGVSIPSAWASLRDRDYRHLRDHVLTHAVTHLPE